MEEGSGASRRGGAEVRRVRVRALLIAAGILSAAAGRSSSAEPSPGATPPPRALAPSPQGNATGPIHLQMKEVEIRGEVERPEVFYIIPRKEARMEVGPLTKDFRDEIMEPLLPGPFEEQVKGRAK